jgi:transposase
MLLSVRALLVRQRTQVANALRGHAAEFGLVAAKGIGRIETLMAAVDAAGDRRSATGQMPPPAKQALALLANRLGQLDAELAALDRRLAALHAATPLSRLLAAVPGIGPSGFPAREPAGVPAEAARHRRPPARGAPRSVLRGDPAWAGSAVPATNACVSCWCSAPPPP